MEEKALIAGVFLVSVQLLTIVVTADSNLTVTFNRDDTDSERRSEEEYRRYEDCIAVRTCGANKTAWMNLARTYVATASDRELQQICHVMRNYTICHMATLLHCDLTRLSQPFRPVRQSFHDILVKHWKCDSVKLAPRMRTALPCIKTVIHLDHSHAVKKDFDSCLNVERKRFDQRVLASMEGDRNSSESLMINQRTYMSELCCSARTTVGCSIEAIRGTCTAEALDVVLQTYNAVSDALDCSEFAGERDCPQRPSLDSLPHADPDSETDF